MKKVGKFMYWMPRILSIVFIIFLTIFSFDVFGEGLGAWEVFLAFLIHNLPSLILTVVLIISWKREIVGGIAFILAGVAFIVFTIYRNQFEWYFVLFNSLIIAGPAFFIGILFLANWKKKKSTR